MSPAPDCTYRKGVVQAGSIMGTEQLLAAMFVIFLAGVAQSLTGFGFGLVAVPLMTLFISPAAGDTDHCDRGPATEPHHPRPGPKRCSPQRHELPHSGGPRRRAGRRLAPRDDGGKLASRLHRTAD